MNKKHWQTLDLIGNSEEVNIAISYLENYSLGIEELDNKSILYFNNQDKDIINSILKNKTKINKWYWKTTYEENWHENWKPFFKDIVIDDKVLITPSWKQGNKANYIEIKIEPSNAFGTGHHQSTELAIHAILKNAMKGSTLLDIGTGTGILSILASRLGYQEIKAIDNDKEISDNFKKNMNLNNVDVKLEILDCLKMQNFNYDLILANINKAIILDLLKIISNKTTIILSGLLLSDFTEVEMLIQNKNFKILKKYVKDEWICLVVKI